MVQSFQMSGLILITFRCSTSRPPMDYETRQLLKQLRSDILKARLPYDIHGRLASKSSTLTKRGNSNNPEGKNGYKRVLDNNGNILVHGEAAYNRGGCRCPVCTRAHSKKMKKLNRKPCIRGCGRLAWDNKKNSGRCKECARKEGWVRSDKSDLTPGA
jgi:hypothetical protein